VKQRIGLGLALLALSTVVACGGSAQVEPGGSALGGAPGSGGAVSGGAPSGSGGSPAAPAVGGSPSNTGGSGAAPPVMGTAGVAGAPGAPDTCWVGGVAHVIGERFACNCNTCWCTPDGNVASTLIQCNDCNYGGQNYVVGETFPSVDGCNQCTCQTSGVSCTDKACACDPDQEWYRQYAARSPKACMVVDYSCPANTRMFGNECGCGCQQASNCPKVIDCEPGADNGCEILKAQCPYSDVAG